MGEWMDGLVYQSRCHRLAGIHRGALGGNQYKHRRGLYSSRTIAVKHHLEQHAVLAVLLDTAINMLKKLRDLHMQTANGAHELSSSSSSSPYARATHLLIQSRSKLVL